MIYLILSVVFASLIFIIFKLYDRYRVNTFQAIIVNYAVACTVGILSYESTVEWAEHHTKSWFIGALLLGFLFIAVFNVMALASQKNGVSVASVAGKMSVVIPIIFAVIVYKDHLGPIKLIGIILALIAVYLTAMKQKNLRIERKNFIYPLLLFLGSGVIDTSLKYLETTYVDPGEVPLFSATIFFFAAISGLLILIFKGIRGQLKIKGINIIGGIMLGVPNYYSVYFLLKALQSETLNSSTVFTINNVAVVMLTTLLGILLFREKLSPKNWLGIAIAVISIFLVAS
ncbi:EamA family transporter [Leptobacterium flavescens]|uniref:EamA family transporter n=1 Tax=Leptobacterium flavescens TaxID=472055 RepID=A0A6P0UJA4_9FLAO|nr:DMT family transporter [Leptobacterium flavescens]NER13294.1 EamA family transporter [Leptobacterium flavescens]